MFGSQVLNLRVLLLRERAGVEEVWVAQCLDYDVTGQGKTVREAQVDFERTLLGEIVIALEHGEVPLAGILPAPARYRDLWDQGVRLADPIPVAPSPELSPVLKEAPERVPRGQAEFRLAG